MADPRPRPLASTPSFGGVLLDAVLRRPLTIRGLLVANLALVGLGTLYCALYCLVAFPPSHGHIMPLSLSAAWAVGTLPPWLLAFEIGKRALLRRPSRSWAIAAIGLAMAAGAGLSIGLTKALDLLFGFGSTGMTSMDLAHQLPRLTLTLAGIALVGWASGRPVLAAMPDSSDAPVEHLLPPSSQIDWIEAAGNYVEIHSGGRVLIRRMTMRQAEAMLERGRFMRVHRSTIVNRDRIAQAALGGARPWLRLDDGTILSVGTRYRHRLKAAAVS